MSETTNILTMSRIDVKNIMDHVMAVRVATPEMHDEEMTAFRNKMKATAARIVQTGRKVVVCCDMRTIQILSPSTASFMVEVLKSDNPMLERSAILIGTGATLGMQLDRIINESTFTKRRRFYDEAVMQHWLAEVLSKEEQVQVKAFLGSYKKSAA